MNPYNKCCRTCFKRILTSMNKYDLKQIYAMGSTDLLTVLTTCFPSVNLECDPFICQVCKDHLCNYLIVKEKMSMQYGIPNSCDACASALNESNVVGGESEMFRLYCELSKTIPHNRRIILCGLCVLAFNNLIFFKKQFEQGEKKLIEYKNLQKMSEIKKSYLDFARKIMSNSQSSSSDSEPNYEKRFDLPKYQNDFEKNRPKTYYENIFRENNNFSPFDKCDSDTSIEIINTTEIKFTNKENPKEKDKMALIIKWNRSLDTYEVRSPSPIHDKEAHEKSPNRLTIKEIPPPNKHRKSPNGLTFKEKPPPNKHLKSSFGKSVNEDQNPNDFKTYMELASKQPKNEHLDMISKELKLKREHKRKFSGSEINNNEKKEKRKYNRKPKDNSEHKEKKKRRRKSKDIGINELTSDTNNDENNSNGLVININNINGLVNGLKNSANSINGLTNGLTSNTDGNKRADSDGEYEDLDAFYVSPQIPSTDPVIIEILDEDEVKSEEGNVGGTLDEFYQPVDLTERLNSAQHDVIDLTSDDEMPLDLTIKTATDIKRVSPCSISSSPKIQIQNLQIFKP